jgi:hypothetical protein
MSWHLDVDKEDVLIIFLIRSLPFFCARMPVATGTIRFFSGKFLVRVPAGNVEYPSYFKKSHGCKESVCLFPSTNIVIPLRTIS